MRAVPVVDEIHVVVPANDEEDLIGRCLLSLESAVRRVTDVPGAPRVHVVVALDACVDGTAGVLAQHPQVSTVVVDARNVGVARAAGVERALADSVAPPSRVWIANTDADTRVPDGWLVRHLAFAREGADAVVGSVRPVRDDLAPERYAMWQARARAEEARPRLHVHGANLGVRASAYRAVGGFAPLAVGEDVDLVERLRRAGSRVAPGRASWVETSARTVGRTPGGYAEYVRTHY